MGSQEKKCKDVLACKQLIAKYPNLIDSLLKENFSQGMAFEKMHQSQYNVTVYSLRTGRRSRILLTKQIIEGEVYWILLTELLRHEYERTPFLKKGYLQAYLQKELPALLREKGLVYLTPRPDSKEVLVKDDQESLIPTELQYYNKKLLILNDPENQALTAKLPLIVTGMPGSGKSLVAMHRLINSLDEEETAERFLYLTASKELKDRMQDIWQSSLGYQAGQSAPIEFKTYLELLEEVFPSTKSQIKVAKEAFTSWLLSYLDKKADLKAKLQVCLSKPMNAVETLYQECRILSASKKFSYRSIGKRQGLLSIEHLPNEEREAFRDAIYQLFEDYGAYLASLKWIDPAFYRFDAPQHKPYAKIVVDEAQDLSHLQLKQLALLVKNKNIAYFIDTNQSLNDNLSKLPFLKQIFGPSFSHIHLPGSFRCSKAVLTLANVVLSLKHFLTGGILDKAIPAQMGISDRSSPGIVSWIEKPNPAQQKELMQAILSTECAVITRKEQVEQARELFPGAIVLTVEQAKGQEFETVIAYRLLDNPDLVQTNPMLSTFQDGSKVSLGRAKKNLAHPEYGPMYNELFTAFTRARESLIIYNILDYKLKHITRALKKDIPDSASSPNLSSKLSISSREQWLEEAIKQLKNNNLDTAKDICFKHLAYDAQQFDALIQAQPTYKKSSSKNEEKFELKSSLKAESPEPYSQTLERKKTKPASRPEPAKALDTPEIRHQKKMSATEYLEKLLEDRENFDFNLRLLFNKNPTKWLFEVPIAGGPLIVHILEDTCKRNVLVVLLNEVENAKKISTWDLCERIITYGDESAFLLYYLCGNPKGLPVLSILLDRNPQIANELVCQRLLCSRKPNPVDEEKNTCILYWLAGSVLGCEIIVKLFDRNPSLLNDIQLEDLYRPRTPAAGIYENSSILSKLAESQLGCRLFLKMIKTRHELARIPAKIFTRLLSPKNKQLDHYTLLYSLSGSIEGRIILLEILNHHTEWVRELTVEDICRVMSAVSIANKNTSVLYWLSTTLQGQTILLRLFALNKTLLRELSIEALCRKRTQASEAYENASTLLWLSKNSEGRSMLLELFQKNPRFAEELRAEDLTSRLTQQSGAEKDVSAFYLLSESTYGCKLLLKLFRSNPKLAAGISTEDLCRRLTDKLGDTYTILFWLCTSSEGCMLLKLFFENNPKIVRELTASDLSLIINPSGQGTTPLHLLAAAPLGGAMLLLIFRENLNLVRQLDANALCFKDTNEEESTNKSVLYWLASRDEGCALLSQLLEQNPCMKEKIIAKALTEIIEGSEQDHLNTSAFYWLCCSAQGQEIIIDALERNPWLKQELRNHFLDLPVHNQEGQANAAIILLNLRKEGRRILKMIFDKPTDSPASSAYPAQSKQGLFSVSKEKLELTTKLTYTG